MASITVPEQHRPGLTKLLNLSADDAQKVASALESIPITGELREVLAETLSALDVMPQDDANNTAEALGSLYAVLAYTNESPSEVAADVVEALGEAGIELKSPDEVQQRLAQLLSFDSILVSVKADGLRYEYENTFSTARVSTDIRPIFGLNAEEPPRAAVITHMLSMHYYRGGQHKEISLALDDIDIEIMMDALERASKKGESLKSIFEAARLTHV